MFHKIKSVTPLEGWQLLVGFAEGCSKLYDMSPLVNGHPAFASLRDLPGLFELVSVDPGGYGISWSDEIDLDGAELWAGGQTTATPFDGLLAFAEATERWGLSESTLRKAVQYRNLREGIDVQKFGKQWVVTLAAMEREYGQPK